VVILPDRRKSGAVSDVRVNGISASNYNSVDADGTATSNATEWKTNTLDKLSYLRVLTTRQGGDPTIGFESAYIGQGGFIGQFGVYDAAAQDDVSSIDKITFLDAGSPMHCRVVGRNLGL